MLPFLAVSTASAPVSCILALPAYLPCHIQVTVKELPINIVPPIHAHGNTLPDQIPAPAVVVENPANMMLLQIVHCLHRIPEAAATWSKSCGIPLYPRRKQLTASMTIAMYLMMCLSPVEFRDARKEPPYSTPHRAYILDSNANTQNPAARK